jgi:Sulfotransferase family
VAKIFRKPNPFPDRPYLLLIGAPRSGTTLLATMIGRHTDVGMLNEDVSGRGIGIILGKRVSGNKLCIPNQIALSGRNFLGRRFLKNIGLVAEAPKSKYCIRDYLELPNMKILAIIRDGHDSVASMMARGKTRLEKAARRWSEAIETIYELKRAYGDRVMVVAFDDLLLQPATVLQRVCAYLGIAFQEQMLDAAQHNPYYPEGALKAEKAHQSKPESAASPLSTLDFPCDKKYQELRDLAQRNLS